MYKLLIVEDEKLIRKGLVAHNPWNEWGFECVGEAENGKEALALFSQYNPDVLLTDLRMPVMNGLTLLSELRKKGADCPIIVISGYADFDYAQEAIQYGAMAYLLKPIKQQELMDTFLRAKMLLDTERYHLAMGLCRVRDITMEPVLSYIESHYNLNICIQQLAEIAHLSISQLMRNFKAETGQSIVKYITDFRINQAKALLDNPTLKIYEVANQVGFDDVSYFCRVFKKSTDYSPTEYRERRV